MAKNPVLAGFQPNVKVVNEEIADFFRQTSKNLRDSLLLKTIEQKKWEVVLEKILPKDELVWGIDQIFNPNLTISSSKNPALRRGKLMKV